MMQAKRQSTQNNISVEITCWYISTLLEQAIKWTPMLSVRKIKSSLRSEEQFHYTSRGQYYIIIMCLYKIQIYK